MKSLFLKSVAFLAMISFLMASCATYKVTNREYREYEGKKTRFSGPKYKIEKNRPPAQRYYNKGSLWRAKK